MAKPLMSDAAVRQLSDAQREMLIAHVDGEVRIVASQPNGARTALIARGLLRPSTQQKNPRATVLTDAGRYALGIVLGDYADALVRAGMLEPPAQLRILDRLKGLRSILPVSESNFPVGEASELKPAFSAGLNLL